MQLFLALEQVSSRNIFLDAFCLFRRIYSVLRLKELSTRELPLMFSLALGNFGCHRNACLGVVFLLSSC